MMLRGAARLEAGMELSDLERSLIDGLRLGMAEDEIREMGRVFTEETSVKGAPQLFPDSLLQRGIAEGYTEADLFKDLPQVRDEVLAQPNVSLVDVAGLEEGACPDSPEFIAGMADYGYGVTLVTSSQPAPDIAAAPAPIRVRLDMHKFICVRDTPESTRDEIYWAYASANDTGTRHRAVTREYGSVNKGSVREFDSNTTLFDGLAGNGLPLFISCWEADDSPSSWYNALSAKLYEIVAKLEEFAAHAGNMPYMWANDPAVGDFIVYATWITLLFHAFIEWIRNDDDLVQERTLGFDQPALKKLAARPDETDRWTFASSEGHFDLYIKASVPDGTRLRHTTSSDGSTWSASVLLPTANATTGAALAVYKDNLYCAHRGSANNENLYWTRFNGTSWNTDTKFGAHMTSPAPALATYGDHLYCVHRGSSNSSALWWTRFNGTAWNTDQTIGNLRTPFQPALAVLGQYLYCFYRGADDSSLWWTRYNGSSWSGHTRLGSHQSADGPAAALFNGKIHVVYRGLTAEELWWCTFDGTNVSAGAKLGTHRSAVAPSLTVFDNKLHCVHRGSTSNANPKLYVTQCNGTSWTTDTAFNTPAGTTVQAPAVAAYRNKLHVVHRGGGIL
ncbi:hypothetical protein [Streptomyces sp. NPDC086989]|uniref:hypothetical protein n=1 Tax=Streptomyces sp. NPDC086989 TaxID=3365764 RepID=UPI003807E4D5